LPESVSSLTVSGNAVVNLVASGTGVYADVAVTSRRRFLHGRPSTSPLSAPPSP
jgi:hypothetical protein